MAKKKKAKSKIETESAHASMGVTVPSSVNFGGARYDIGVAIRCPELAPDDALDAARSAVESFMDGSMTEVFKGLNDRIKKTAADSKRGR